MSLEACPTCGYALSTVDHHCRHCATAPAAMPSQLAKNLQPIIMAGVGLAVVLYLLFFR